MKPKYAELVQRTIGLTLAKKQSIEKFEQLAATARPWL